MMGHEDLQGAVVFLASDASAYVTGPQSAGRWRLDVPVSMLIVGGGSIGERHLRCFQQIGCDVALCETNAERRQRDRRAVSLAAHVCGDRARRPASVGTASSSHAGASARRARRCRSPLLRPALLIEKPLCTQLDRCRATARGHGGQGRAGRRTSCAFIRRRSACAQLLADDEIGHAAPGHGHRRPALSHVPPGLPRHLLCPPRDRRRRSAGRRHALVRSDSVPGRPARLGLLRLRPPGTGGRRSRRHRPSRRPGRRRASSRVAGPQPVHGAQRNARAAQRRTGQPRPSACTSTGPASSCAATPAWTWTEPLVAERDDLFRAQAESFLAAMVGRQEPLCSLADGVQALKVNLAALRSSETRAPVAIDSP